MRKKNWPDGLYERDDGYFSWRNPLTGEELGIGRVTVAEASAQAVEANLHVRNLMKKPRLVDRITGVADRTVKALVDAYDKKLQQKIADKELAENTLKTLRSCGRAAKRAWGDRVVERVTTLDAAKLLGEYKEAGKRRMAQAIRSYLNGLFDYAAAEGWIQRGTNPVTITDEIKVTVKRARLSFEQFQIIYDAAKPLDAWVRHSMELAIVSARRREDLAEAEFKQQSTSLVWASDRDRHLYVIQQKVDDEDNPENLRLRIPYELTLNVLGWSLEWAIAQCRSDHVVSRWLIHHSKRRTKSRPGDRVWIDTITKGFTRARKRTSLTWPEGLEPPTFHEIRSLAARLYEKQGNVDVQMLLGHTDPETTELYKDSRGTEWTDVKVA